MGYPSIKFITSLEADANYICFLAKSITNGFYTRSGYKLLPYVEKGNHQTCYFPDLDYTPNFWSKIKANKNCHFSQDFPPEAVKEVMLKLSAAEALEHKTVAQSVQLKWGKIENLFFDTLSQFLDINSVLPNINQLEFLLTKFGTAGSYYPLPTKNGYKIFATQRMDMPLDMVGKTILLAFDKIMTKKEGKKGDFTWFNRQNNVEYLLSSSVFHNLLPDISTSKITNNKRTMTLILNSKSYLAKLGFHATPIIKEVDGKLTIKDMNAHLIFTKNEYKLLQELVNNQWKVVSFDNAANLIWENKVEEKFSMYSLAKTVENIRRKIRNLGIYKEVVYTIRGIGYAYAENN